MILFLQMPVSSWSRVSRARKKYTHVEVQASTEINTVVNSTLIAYTTLILPTLLPDQLCDSQFSITYHIIWFKYLNLAHSVQCTGDSGLISGVFMILYEGGYLTVHAREIYFAHFNCPKIFFAHFNWTCPTILMQLHPLFSAAFNVDGLKDI